MDHNNKEMSMSNCLFIIASNLLNLGGSRGAGWPASPTFWRIVRSRKLGKQTNSYRSVWPAMSPGIKKWSNYGVQAVFSFSRQLQMLEW